MNIKKPSKNDKLTESKVFELQTHKITKRQSQLFCGEWCIINFLRPPSPVSKFLRFHRPTSQWHTIKPSFTWGGGIPQLTHFICIYSWNISSMGLKVFIYLLNIMIKSLQLYHFGSLHGNNLEKVFWLKFWDCSSYI